MSLSAAREAARRAHASTSSASTSSRPASRRRTPRSSSSSSCWRGERFEHARDRRLRHDPPARRRRRRGRRACACSPTASRRSARSSARPGRCTSRRSCASTARRTCAMIAESVAFLVAAGKRVVYDAEHFFDGYRDDPGYALDCLRAAAGAGRRDASCCATPTARRCRRRSPRRRAAVRGRGRRPASRVGIHCHNDAECGVANTLAAVEAGATPGPGHDERLRRAHRQRQPRLDHRQPPAQAGPRACSADEQLARLTEAAHFVDELLNRTPDPRPALRRAATPSPTRAGMHVAGVRADARDVRARRPGARRQPRASCSSPSSPGAARSPSRPRAAGLDARRRRPPRASSSASRSSSTAATSSRPPTARSSCCCAARPATTSRCSASSPGA